MRRMTLATLAGAALLGTGCKSINHGPYTPPTEEQRNTVTAEQLNREAADLIHSDPERAETLLREALTADLLFGPAHNNLGVVFLERGELYEAAQEFEWARRLMPSEPDLRINLAIALERAGLAEDALAEYEGALEVSPGSVAAMQGWAWLANEHDARSTLLPERLNTIAVQGETERWRAWARDSAHD